MEIEYIIKRDYSTKAFHLEKISGAIHKAMNAVGHGDEQNAQDVALSVYQTLVGRKENDVEYVPTIEEVQDIVCLLYTSPSPRDGLLSRMPSSA